MTFYGQQTGPSDGNEHYVMGSAQPDPSGGKPPKRRIALVLTSAFVVISAAIVGSGVIGWSIGKSETKTTSEHSRVDSQGTAETTTTAPPRPKKTMTPRDFDLEVTILEKKCFGSAGCNVQYDIQPVYTGNSVSDLTGQSLKVIFEVSGGDSDQVGNFTVDGMDIRMRESYSISTPSEGSEITAEVVRVIPN